SSYYRTGGPPGVGQNRMDLWGGAERPINAFPSPAVTTAIQPGTDKAALVRIAGDASIERYRHALLRNLIRGVVNYRSVFHGNGECEAANRGMGTDGF